MQGVVWPLEAVVDTVWVQAMVMHAGSGWPGMDAACVIMRDQTCCMTLHYSSNGAATACRVTLHGHCRCGIGESSMPLGLGWAGWFLGSGMVQSGLRRRDCWRSLQQQHQAPRQGCTCMHMHA